MINSLVRFARDERGSYAMMTGVLILPLIFGVGLAVDTSTIARKHSELQNATDSAVLAIAREGKDISDERAREIANQYLTGNFDLAVTQFDVTRDGTRINLGVKSRTDLAFGGVVGRDSWPITANSAADVAYAFYEIGLVLDTTGSMAGGKLAAMKDAVNGLIDTMSTQVKEKERLKFAMVPFSNFVNVGKDYGPRFDKKGQQIADTGATWLDLYGKAVFPQLELVPGASRFQVYQNMDQTWPGCVETRYDDGSGQDVSDLPPNNSKPSSLFVPAFGIDEPDVGGYTNNYIQSDSKAKDKSAKEMKKKMKKYGIETDANGVPLLGGLLGGVVDIVFNTVAKIKIDTGVSSLTGRPKGPGTACTVQPILPLGNDYTAIKAKVDSLQASGNTNITEGVAWGMRVLSPGEPFNQGRDPKKELTEKIMIVLTDGSNVFGENNTELGSNYSSNGFLVDERLTLPGGGGPSPTELMNRKTLAACTNAKKDGMEIYTIRLEEPNAKTGYMLKECATDEAHFIDVPSRAQLDEAFKVIQDRIVRIRIAS